MTEVIKDEAYYTAQAAEAELALARLRRPRLEAALAALDGLAAGMSDLVATRDALPDGQAKQAVNNVISVLTSAPGTVRHEISALAKEPSE